MSKINNFPSLKQREIIWFWTKRTFGPVAFFLEKYSILNFRIYTMRHSKTVAVNGTTRYLKFRVREHIQRAGPMKSHLSQCITTITEENIYILKTSSREEYYLLTLSEALHIRENKKENHQGCTRLFAINSFFFSSDHIQLTRLYFIVSTSFVYILPAGGIVLSKGKLFYFGENAREIIL